MKNTMKLTAFGSMAVLCSSLFYGCAGPSAVTAENAPSDLLKQAAQITSDAAPSEVQDVFSQIIEATAKNADYHLILSEEAKGSGLSLDSDELASSENTFRNYDVRYGTDDCFYQVYEEEGSGDAIYGLMASDADSITTVYANPAGDDSFGKDNGEFTIASINTQPSEIDAANTDMKASIENAVSYPLNTMLGASLVLQPSQSPESYNFVLEKNGGKYIWTMSIADQKEYNKSLDDAFENVYGHSRLDIKGDGSIMLDSYDVTEVSLRLTMNEDGALEAVQIDNKSEVTKGDQKLDLSSADSISIRKADDKWLTFFEGFFKEIENESLKQDDSFTLLQSFGQDSSESGSQSESKADSQKESSQSASSKTDDTDEKKTNSSNEESKQESESKAVSESKSESSEDSASSDSGK